MIELGKPFRVLALHLIHPRLDKEASVNVGEEFESLIATLGGEIVERLVQKLDRPDHATYIGKGKVEELLELIRKTPVDIVVLSTMAKPMQVHTLKTRLQEVNPKIDVWDRIDLILHIFDKHANTTEAKLQIELARMRYMGPRIYGMGYILSRQGGGIGTSGIGETNTELMKRHWRNEIKKVSDQLDKLTQSREEQIERRKKAGFKTVSIVGYTNAGKSSLFNLLTGKKMLVEDVLFATLDSTVGKIYMQELKEEILITDTIGFIRDLPPRLIKAFTSTLLQSLHADILLHVIDIADPDFAEKIHVVHEILLELKGDTRDVIFVFNKIDRAQGVDRKALSEKYFEYSPVFLSTKTGEGMKELQETIVKRFHHPMV